MVMSVVDELPSKTAGYWAFLGGKHLKQKEPKPESLRLFLLQSENLETSFDLFCLVRFV